MKEAREAGRLASLNDARDGHVSWALLVQDVLVSVLERVAALLNARVFANPHHDLVPSVQNEGLRVAESEEWSR